MAASQGHDTLAITTASTTGLTMRRNLYIASSVYAGDATGWFVLRCGKSGGIVARGLTQARAIRLADTLNQADRVLRMPWWVARDPEPPKST